MTDKQSDIVAELRVKALVIIGCVLVLGMLAVYGIQNWGW